MSVLVHVNNILAYFSSGLLHQVSDITAPNRSMKTARSISTQHTVNHNTAISAVDLMYSAARDSAILQTSAIASNTHIRNLAA